MLAPTYRTDDVDARFRDMLAQRKRKKRWVVGGVVGALVALLVLTGLIYAHTAGDSVSRDEPAPHSMSVS